MMQVMVNTFQRTQLKAKDEVSSVLTSGMETGVCTVSLHSLPQCSITNADMEDNFIEREADDR